MKKIFLFTFIFFITGIFSASLFAEPVMSPFRKLEVIKTKHFDIIYPKESESTAFYLAEEAENIFQKVADIFEPEQELFFPVVISPSTQTLNAHYLPFPYAHILIYDTMVSGESSLNNYKHTLNDIFLHELIHAVSLTLRSDSVEKVTSVFSDAFSVPIINMTVAWLEGAAVAAESAEGYGRLNNGDILAYAVQAKLENKFPDYYEISGGRNIFPSGQYPYYFGGLFAKYLQDKYGMEKFRKIWKQEDALIQKAFSEIYGISLFQAWEDFKDSIPVPVVTGSEDIKKINSKPGVFKQLKSAVRNGTPYYIFYSYYENAVYSFCENQKPVKLFSSYNVLDMNFSSDGNFILVTDVYPDNLDSVRLRIFDIEKNSFVRKSLKNVKTGALYSAGQKKYLAAIEQNTSDSSLNIYDFETLSLISKFPVEHFTEVLNVCSLPDGFAMIIRKDGKWFTATAHPEFNQKKNSALSEKNQNTKQNKNAVPSSENNSDSLQYTETVSSSENNFSLNLNYYELPENIIPLSMHASVKNSFSQDEDTELILSVTGTSFSQGHSDLPSTLSRYAAVKISPQKKAEIIFQQNDISGGVHNPAINGNRLTFISRTAEWYDINTSSISSLPPGKIIPLEEKILNPFITESNNQTTNTNAEVFSTELTSLEELKQKFTASDMNPLDYFKKVTFLPVATSLLPETDFDYFLTATTDPYLGALVITGLPSENFYTGLSAGYNPFTQITKTNSFIAGGNIGFKFGLSCGLVFFENAFNNFYAETMLAGSFPIFTHSLYFSYQANAVIRLLENGSFKNQNLINAGLSYSKPFSMNRYDRFQLYLGTFWTSSCMYDTKGILGKETGANSPLGNIGFKFILTLPRLLPFNNPWHWTLNLPVKTTATLYPDSHTFLNFKSDFTLMGKEIQKQFFTLPVYFQNLKINGGVTASFAKDLDPMCLQDTFRMAEEISDMKQKSAVFAGIHLYSVPTIGFASYISLDLCVEVSLYLLNQQDDEKYGIKFFGSMNF